MYPLSCWIFSSIWNWTSYGTCSWTYWWKLFWWKSKWSQYTNQKKHIIENKTWTINTIKWKVWIVVIDFYVFEMIFVFFFQFSIISRLNKWKLISQSLLMKLNIKCGHNFIIINIVLQKIYKIKIFSLFINEWNSIFYLITNGVRFSCLFSFQWRCKLKCSKSEKNGYDKPIITWH